MHFQIPCSGRFRSQSNKCLALPGEVPKVRYCYTCRMAEESSSLVIAGYLMLFPEGKGQIQILPVECRLPNLESDRLWRPVVHCWPVASLGLTWSVPPELVYGIAAHMAVPILASPRLFTGRCNAQPPAVRLQIICGASILRLKLFCDLGLTEHVIASLPQDKVPKRASSWDSNRLRSHPVQALSRLPPQTLLYFRGKFTP